MRRFSRDTWVLIITLLVPHGCVRILVAQLLGSVALAPIMSLGDKFNASDGKGAQRAAFRDEWDRQFRFLPTDRQEAINRDPTALDADLLFESVKAELLRREAAEE